MGAKLPGVTICAVFALMAVTAFAHHPFNTEYDWKKPVTLTGTVTKVQWENPHALLFMDAKDADGKMTNWTLEMGSVGALTNAGWKRDTIKVGDQITVDGWRAKNANNRANVKSVTLSNGRELSAASSFVDTLKHKQTE
jgi:hypothetical protein